MITIVLTIFGIYLLIGVVFALPFVFVGAKRIDPSAVDGTFLFRLAILPGSAVFWPLLLSRWLRGNQPTECSQHRRAAKS